MHFIYKLIALSVVFGLVFTDTVTKITTKSIEDQSENSMYELDNDSGMDEGRTIEAVGPALNLIPAALSLLPNVLGLKVKAVEIAVMIMKWLAPKSFYLAIGAIATLAFCKISNLCNLTYDPVVYDYVPSQVKNLVTPERLNEAQHFLMDALQQYSNQNTEQSWYDYPVQ